MMSSMIPLLCILLPAHVHLVTASLCTNQLSDEYFWINTCLTRARFLFLIPSLLMSVSYFSGERDVRWGTQEHNKVIFRVFRDDFIETGCPWLKKLAKLCLCVLGCDKSNSSFSFPSWTSWPTRSHQICSPSWSIRQGHPCWRSSRIQNGEREEVLWEQSSTPSQHCISWGWCFCQGSCRQALRSFFRIEIGILPCVKICINLCATHNLM